MQKFDESTLLGELAAMPPYKQTAFAVSAAARQLGSYEWYARNFEDGIIYRPREYVTVLWSESMDHAVDHEKWHSRLDNVMALLPEESDDWTITYAFADDALSSLVYAIRSLLSSDPREAVWAARRAYEAVDQAAIRILRIQAGQPDTELAIRCHPLVQRELGRQQRDLDILLKASDPYACLILRDHASHEFSLTKEDLMSLELR